MRSSLKEVLKDIDRKLLKSLSGSETVSFYNTRTRAHEVFHPKQEGKVGLYVCGPTVYAYPHIGNMRAYFFADTLRRGLELCGYDVNHVMNITDVGHLTDDGDDGEDKLEVGARKEGVSAWDIAKKYEKYFFQEVGLLNILTPKIVCRATEHIEQQVDMVQKLDNQGFTYTTSDGVYFDTTKFPKYGDFAKLNKEGMQAGLRVDMGEKKNLQDFALWKFSKPEDKRAMEWDSPWGRGFPGWHIECSAMASHYLGDQFDIHTGGVDHIQVHHTNEIAQAECATSKAPFVNVWLHSEWLILDDGTKKMGKSLGNIICVNDLKKDGIPPDALRYLFLQAHYRKQLLFKKENLAASCKAVKRLLSITSSWDAEKGDFQKEVFDVCLKKMLSSVCNDLNTPQVLAQLWELVENDSVSISTKMKLRPYYAWFLGLKLDAVLEDCSDKASVPQEVFGLMDQRKQYRAEKNWDAADKVRSQLDSLGYEVCDSPEGPVARKKSFIE